MITWFHITNYIIRVEVFFMFNYIYPLEGRRRNKAISLSYFICYRFYSFIFKINHALYHNKLYHHFEIFIKLFLYKFCHRCFFFFNFILMCVYNSKHLSICKKIKINKMKYDQNYVFFFKFLLCQLKRFNSLMKYWQTKIRDDKIQLKLGNGNH